MGIIKRLKNLLDTSDPTADITDPLLRALLSGSNITRADVMKIPAVSSDVDLISSTIAMMPIRLYKRTAKDGKVEVEEVDDNRVRLLNDDTQDTLDGYQFKKAMVEDYLLGKGGFAYINRSRNKVKSIHYVKNEFISIMKNEDPIYKNYEINCNGVNYKPMEFLQLLRTTQDGMDSRGITDEVSDALKAAYETIRYQLNTVSKGGNKKGFLTAETTIRKEYVDELKAAWRKMYANNEENVVVLNNGIKFQESSNSCVEMQLNESKITFANEINAIFHMDNDYNTFFKKAIMPICTAFKTALNRNLLLEKEKAEYFWEWDYKELLKGNLRERYEAYKIAKETGWLTKNEIRIQENKERIDGLDTVDVGLGAVLYDITTGEYYTPNTGETRKLGEGGKNEPKD